MPKRREFLLGSVAWLATVAASRSALAQAPSPGLRTYLAGEMRKARIPGMQIAVVRQERIEFLEHFGLADIENAVPVTGATVFQIASLTKAFVGVAVSSWSKAAASTSAIRCRAIWRSCPCRGGRLR